MVAASSISTVTHITTAPPLLCAEVRTTFYILGEECRKQGPVFKQLADCNGSQITDLSNYSGKSIKAVW